MAFKDAFRKFGVRLYRALEPRPWRQAREAAEAKAAAERQRAIDEYNDLLARMKPDDGTLAYIQDPGSLGTSGVIVAIETAKFMSYLSTERPDALHGLGRQKSTWYARVVQANHGMHVMPEITLDANDVVRIREGRNRIYFFLQHQKYILINVGNDDNDSADEFARKVQLVKERFGVDGLGFTLRGEAVFCRCTFSEGPYPYVRMIDRPLPVSYYTINEPPAPTPAIQPTRKDPSPPTTAPDPSTPR